MKVAIGIASPRDIPDFIEAMSKINEHKVWIKYADEYTAYLLMRKLFLDVEDFTHLCIIPDDLIVRPEQFEKLKLSVEKYNYPVLSGTCAIDVADPTRLATRTNEETLWDKDAIVDQGITDIRQVFAEGFACCFMRRDVVEKIWFNCEVSFDLYLARECKKRNIPINVDFSVRLKHLAGRKGIGIMENCGIGLKRPEVIFQ